MVLDTFTANGVLHKAPQIYNCDETGMPLGATHRKVVASVGSNPSYITSNKQQITVLACISAAGVTLPPFVIFKEKLLTIL